MAIDRRRMSGYVPLREAMNQLFEGSFITPGFVTSAGAFPQADLHVTEDDVLIHLAIPGVKPSDVDISVTGDTVTISGEIQRSSRPEKHQSFYEEIVRGRFQRSFTLPIQVDANKADATFADGMLTLTLPKSEATKPRRIQIHSQQEAIEHTNGKQADASKAEAETSPLERVKS